MQMLGVIIGCMCIMQAAAAATQYDVVIRQGMIYDGSGAKPQAANVAITGDRIAAIGELPADARGKVEIDAKGLAIAPGFINMLSWANESLIRDPKSQSDIRQGVTLEVLGEGISMGPLNPLMKRDLAGRQDDVRYQVAWTTLREYLEWLTRRGISPNVASFVGAATLRIHEIGYADRRPTREELDRMRVLARQAMEEGAVGVSSALIYVPGAFAHTDELVALAEIAAEYDGMYISHIRSEGEKLLEAVDELLTIARRAKVRAEIYHMKAAGRPNWGKLDEVFRRIEAAQAEGLHITADMYPYDASSTGLDTLMPEWSREGGHQAWISRLRDPATRERIRKEIRIPTGRWGGDRADQGSAKNVLLVGFRNKALRPLAGKTLEEVAAARGKSPEDTVIDLVIEDDSRVGAVFFSMQEDNVRKELQKPWISFCSDAGSLAPEGVFLRQQYHPRAYGAFARVLGKYVRDEKLIPLDEAIRRLTRLPADNLKLDRRGRLEPGFFADVVVFDPAKIQDHATYENPHQYATGMVHVFVNGRQVLKDGQHTGAKPGRFVRGPGARRHEQKDAKEEKRQ